MYALKADYEMPLGQGKLGAGLKIAHINTTNDFQFFDIRDQTRVIDIERTNDFAYEENVNAAYFNYRHKLSKKINSLISLSTEQTNLRGILTVGIGDVFRTW